MTDVIDTCDGLGDEKRTATDMNLPEGVPPLRTFYLYLSDGCNLRCRHCWITPTFVQGKPVPAECLDYDLLKAAVAEAKPMGLKAAKLTGGEPTLHPEFRRIADLLSEEGLSLTMETNGTLIDAKMARHLREVNKLSHVAVSLDSTDVNQHDRFRGKRGAHADTVRGLQHLVEAGFRPQIIMSVFRENLEQVEPMIALALRLGVGSVKFNPVTTSGRGAELHAQGLALSFEEMMDLAHRVRGPLQDRVPIRLCLMLPPALSTVREILREKSGGGSCHVRHILGILGSGEMALCGIGRNIPELCFGRLGKDSVRDVWISHPTLVRMRQDLDGVYPGLCGDCVHAKRCLTHCVAMNYEANGSLVSVSPLCAEAEQRGMFPDSRRVTFGPCVG